MDAAHVTPIASKRFAFLVFGRILPLAFFALLLVIQGQLMIPEMLAALGRFPDPESVLMAASDVVQLVFVAGIAVIYLVRKAPLGRRHQPIAVVAAFYASFILLARPAVQGALGIHDGLPSQTALVLSGLLVFAGLAFTLYSLFYLRLSFSIVPEARKLVTGGPYRFVRHPIYLGEIITGLGIVLGRWTLFAAALWLTMVLAQLVRTRYEEDVLLESFPVYAEYSRHTKRVIPWLA